MLINGSIELVTNLLTLATFRFEPNVGDNFVQQSTGLQLGKTTMRKFRNSIFCLLALGLAALLVTPVVARADQYTTPCVTKSECDLREEQAAQAARNAEWKRGEQVQGDISAHNAERQADSYNRAESGKLTRLQEVMRRRRAAAAVAAGQ